MADDQNRNPWQPGQILSGVLGGFARQGSTRSEPASSQSAMEGMGYGPDAARRASYLEPKSQSAQGYGAAAGRATNMLVGEGFRLQGEEQQGLDWAKDQLRQQWPELMKNPLSEGDINALASNQFAAIERDKMQSLLNLREFLGETDLEGGLAADLGIQTELGALGQVAQVRGGLLQRHAEMTAQHQMSTLNAIGAGQQIMGAQSTYGAEAASAAAGYYASMQGAEREAEAAAAAAKSNKESSIIGGVIGLAGSLLSGGLF